MPDLFAPFSRTGVAADFGFDQPVVQVVFEIAQDAPFPVVAVDQVAQFVVEVADAAVFPDAVVGQGRLSLVSGNRLWALMKGSVKCSHL